MSSGFNAASPYYQSSDSISPIPNPQVCVEITFTPESNSTSFFGASEHDGATKAFAKVKQGLNVESLGQKAEAWSSVAGANSTWADQLRDVGNSIFQTRGVWEGDDADAALKIFNGTLASADAMKGYTSGMSTALTSIHGVAKQAVGTASSGGSSGFLGTGLGGGGGDGSEDEKMYFALANGIDSARSGHMPTNVQYQNKSSTGSPTVLGGHATGLGGGAASAGGPVGGAGTSSHVSDPGLNGIGDPKGTGPGTTWTDPTHGHPGGPGDPIGPPITTGPPTGSNPTPITPVGGGNPPMGGGSTLASYNPTGLNGGAGGSFGGSGVSGLGGVGNGLGGVGGGSGLAGSGLSGAGLSGSGLGGAGLSGSGLGAGGAVGGLAGDAAASEAAEAGSGRDGMMMPMRGGGGGGNGDDERERSTWLNEDDDVWGVDAEAPPTTIS